MRTSVLGGLVLAVSMTAGAAAQSRPAVTLAVQPGSKVWIEGTSSLHPWSCTAAAVTGDIQVDSGYASEGITAGTKLMHTVRITVPVKEMTCGHDGMNKNMYKALKENEYPTIQYTLGDYDLVPASGDANGFTVKSRGTLTIAGTAKPVSMDVQAHRASDGGITVEGREQVVMTEYGVKPPTALLGTIKTGDTVVVHFALVVAPAAAGGAVGSR